MQTTDPYGGWVPPTPPPPTPDEQRPPQRVLRRSRTDRVGAGVAGGLGDYFDTDPVLFRVLFATATFFGGVGVIAYVLAWLAIPEAGTEHAAIDRWVGELRRRTVPVWLVAAVGLIAVWGIGFSWWAPHPFVPLLLVAIVVAVVLSRRRSARPSNPPTAPPAGPSAPVDLTKPGQEELRPEWAVETRQWLAEARLAGRVRRRRARPVLLATLGALVLALGILVVCDVVGGIVIPAYFWVLLVVPVLGLIVGLALRRPPWSLALFLIPALAGVVAFGNSGASLHDGLGQRQWTPTSSLAESYRLGAGQGVLDLHQLTPSATARTTTVVIGAGQARILLPAGLNATVNANVHIGQIEVDGASVAHRDRSGGYDLSHVVLPPAGAAGAAITIDVELTNGQIAVEHG